MGRKRAHPKSAGAAQRGADAPAARARQFLLPLAAEPGFPALWASALAALAECTKPRSEELAEAVPEALKNMLLVMAAQGVLTPAWTVRPRPQGVAVRTLRRVLTPARKAGPQDVCYVTCSTARRIHDLLDRQVAM